MSSRRSKAPDAALPIRQNGQWVASAPSSAIDPRDVQDRRQLNDYLSQSLASQYRVFERSGEVTQTATFVKSYLVEVHTEGEYPFPDQWFPVFPQVLPRQDDSLLLLVDKADVPYFVDMSDPRFLVLHTIGRTDTTDATVERLTQGVVDGFDRAWLPTNFLLGTRRGPLRGFKFGHQTALVGLSAPELDMLDDEYSGNGTISMEDDDEASQDQIESGVRSQRLRRLALSPFSRLSVSNTLSAENDYQRIMGAKVFEGRQALDSVHFVSMNEQRDRMINGVYATGKIIGSGTSIGLHLLIVNGVRHTYGRAIRRIESDIALGWVRSGEARVYRGQPIVIKVPDGLITDLRQFVLSLFGATRPFRLFGIPHSITDGRIDVEAIDLHTNDPLSFEITHSWMRVFLPRGSCGNIVARLYANLQHAAHSDIWLGTGGGEALFTEADAGEE